MPGTGQLLDAVESLLIERINKGCAREDRKFENQGFHCKSDIGAKDFVGS